MQKRLMLIGFLCLLVFSTRVHGGDLEARMQVLEETLKKQAETIKEQQQTIDELKERMRHSGIVPITEASRGKTDPAKATSAAVRIENTPKPLNDGEPQQKAINNNRPFGESPITGPNISLVLNTYASSSNLSTEELRNRGITGYTVEGLERRNGFNLEAAELNLYAPVDPYFNLYATIPVTEEGATVEEAYFITTALPRGHQLKGGKFKSGFGRHNAFHPHAWDFVDAPLPYRAFTGTEGIIEKGLQYTYLAPLPFYALLGAEVLQGENKVLFGSDAASGAHAYSAFAKASFDLGDDATLLFGPSVTTGKTKTDTVRVNTDFTGDSTLYALEFTYKWKPSKDRALKLQAEYLYRSQFGSMTDTSMGSVSRLDRNQDGGYLQGVYRWRRWDAGLRYDTLGLFKDHYSLGGLAPASGHRPWRATGMVDYNFSEFSLLRLQYNHDESNPAGKTNHEGFLQFIFSVGAHGAHAF